MKSKNHSLLLGSIAILGWGSLATLGSLIIHLPPFYTLAVSFFIGSLPALLHPKELFPSLSIFLWGTLGYFGYHFFLFYSFRFAPAVEANLINYLWPVLLILLAPLFFPKEQLRWYHGVGAMLAILGSIFLVMGEGLELKSDYLKGYLLALGAAFTWPLYSLGKKRMPPVSVWAVGGFTLGASLLCFITHLSLEPAVELQASDAGILLLLGLGPCGLSFYCWDQALKKGDARVIGALSYLTPVLSTLGLIFFTDQILTLQTFVAMVLIIGGASLGLLDFLPQKLNKD